MEYQRLIIIHGPLVSSDPGKIAVSIFPEPLADRVSLEAAITYMQNTYTILIFFVLLDLFQANGTSTQRSCLLLCVNIISITIDLELQPS
ncbi:hypothetical protein Tsubulata_050061 [Turnera subulata]|uniref:Uncharacterized protein n=1 Tax=Turnera subulata TaxID=218843 RepID=A0A9Q0FWW4_9ROSI|nr:hypothetical protein Tsubulata_050061 [Turnera subulata]